MGKHLAQFNLARFKGDKNGPHMADFYANLDRINAIGDRMPGFVWRLKTAEGGSAPPLTVPGDDGLSANLTVWESIETLETFTWSTVHAKIYARKGEWFEPHTEPNLVLWWIEAGHLPSIPEGLERLDHLRRHGAGDYAFDWKAAPAARLWRERKCA